MKYKLIGIDLDGTLLKEDKTISRANKDCIKDALNMGIHVTLCSGRPIDLVKGYAEELNLKQPFVTCNGASIVEPDTRESIFVKGLEFQSIKTILDYALERDIRVHVFTDKIMYTNISPDDEEMFIWKESGQAFEYKPDMDIDIKQDIIKIMFNDDVDTLMHARKDLEQILAQKVKIYFVMGRYLEFMDINVSKGRAISFIADKLGIAREQVIAIGDNENDISMIRYAGLGIAMDNADQMVKQVADHITDCNECDGVAKAIRKFAIT
ncbi:MAG: Cof-type HAD-IIB family hydrolase [Clostridia bacterium]|nr:Cof-type HAD-IIB family hydrolase [Clostridia bacterium]